MEILMKQLIKPVFQKEKNLICAFSTKEGASDKSPYEQEAVFQMLQMNHMPKVYPKQVHGNHVALIKKDSSFHMNQGNLILPDTDGMVTNQKQLVLTTVHADCLAVFFYDPIQHVIGLVHAGWRGSAQKIAEKAAILMINEFQSNPSDIKVFISPGISSCCFETGVEVFDAFQKSFSWASDYAEKKGDKYFLDLKKINERQLMELGIKDITIDSDCTCCHSDLYCSYRKEPGTTKRMGALMVMV